MGWRRGDLFAQQRVDAAIVAAGRAIVKHGDDALARTLDPTVHELAGQSGVDAERERKIAAQRVAEAVLVVDADAGNVERRGRDRRERLEIGDEQVGLLDERELADLIERFAASAKEAGRSCRRCRRWRRRRSAVSRQRRPSMRWGR